MPACSRPRRAVRGAAAAVSFLTCVPVGRAVALDADDVGRGAPLFPLVGAGIGCVVGIVAAGANGVLPPLAAAAVAIVVEAVLTGAIHLDALADTADALGARTRERALEVMRDPAIGSFGALALALAVLVKTAAVASLLAGEDVVFALAAAFALGRAAPLVLGWALPYARSSGGGGRALTDGMTGRRLLVGLLLACGVALAALRGDAAAVLAGAGLAVAVVGLGARRRFGGATGDVLGAATETATALALLGAAAAR